MMKVGFSFNKTSSVAKKRPEPDQIDRDYVTDISGNKLKSLHITKQKDGPLVIPLETQGVAKKSKVTTTEDVIKVEPTPDQAPQAVESKPKTLDELAVDAVISEAKGERQVTQPDKILPIILQNQIDGIERFADEDERFKYDLAARPDEADIDAYEEVPIEEFGMAMLRGMGWEVGKAIGLNNRGLTEPIEYVPRHGRLGLGATPETIEIKKPKKYIKPGESREPKPVMVAPTGPDGKVRHVKRISEKLVPLNKGILRKVAAIGSGPHEGLYARVTQELQNDEVLVRLLTSEEDVVVPKSDLNFSVLTADKLSENHPALKYMSTNTKNSDSEGESKSESKSKNSKKSKKSTDEKYIDLMDESTSDSKSKSKLKSKSKSKSKSEDTTENSDEKSHSTTWLHPHIMVRLVSKKSDEGGKYYNKKGHIVDVVGRRECTVQLLDGSLIEGIKQKWLETVIPKPGGSVLVVAGSHKGDRGTLMEMRKNKHDKDAAVIKLFSDFSIHTYELDDISEYVGSLDD